MRISEALALRWDDIDLERNVIRVHRQATPHGDSHTKNRRFRAVSVGERMVGVLRDLYERQSELYDQDLTRHQLFPTPTGPARSELRRRQMTISITPIDRSTVSRDRHKRALKDAGLRDMPLNSLRHTAAASWLLAGQPLIYVQRQLGPSSITTTERYHGQLEQTSAHTAANATEAAICNTPD
jgi:integrase